MSLPPGRRGHPGAGFPRLEGLLGRPPGLIEHIGTSEWDVQIVAAPYLDATRPNIDRNYIRQYLMCAGASCRRISFAGEGRGDRNRHNRAGSSKARCLLFTLSAIAGKQRPQISERLRSQGKVRHRSVSSFVQMDAQDPRGRRWLDVSLDTVADVHHVPRGDV